LQKLKWRLSDCRNKELVMDLQLQPKVKGKNTVAVAILGEKIRDETSGISINEEESQLLTSGDKGRNYETM